jgi:uncharacterized protein (TIGR02453 family)
MSRIDPATLDFLRELRQHNDRDWFNAHKARYLAARENLEVFATALLARMNETDVIETPNAKKSLFRIYRDTRFAKNKTPYKTNMGGSLSRSGAQRRGGYYYSIQPGGESVIGGGFYGPERDDLLRIRQEIAADAQPLREILATPRFQKFYSALAGDALKTAPKGFDRDHPDIDLLRFKNFFVMHQFSDAEVTQADFLDRVIDGWLLLRPFFDYMSEVLTTDVNGVPIS